jgi:hypothetical protein
MAARFLKEQNMKEEFSKVHIRVDIAKNRPTRKANPKQRPLPEKLKKKTQQVKMES